MNLVILTGRLTKDPEIRENNENKVAMYTLAVDKRFKREGQAEADFIRCKAWNKAADFAEKYLKKGTKILINGRIDTGSYKDKEGKTIYTTDVVVDSHEFCEGKKSSENASNDALADFVSIPDGFAEELPFA